MFLFMNSVCVCFASERGLTALLGPFLFFLRHCPLCRFALLPLIFWALCCALTLYAPRYLFLSFSVLQLRSAKVQSMRTPEVRTRSKSRLHLRPPQLTGWPSRVNLLVRAPYDHSHLATTVSMLIRGHRGWYEQRSPITINMVLHSHKR